MPERRDREFQISALNDLRSQFVLALEADTAQAAAQPVRRVSFEWRRAWAVPAIALAVAIIALAISTIPWSGSPTVSEAIADVARSALSADYPPDNWFTYTRSRNQQQNLAATPDHTPRAVRFEREAWLSVSRRGTIRSKLLGEPNAAPIVSSYPAYGRYRIGSKTYTRRQIDAFARKPQLLLDEIDAQVAAAPPDLGFSEKWIIITEALRDLSPPLPAQLRAALIGDLASVKGVRVADGDKDPLGRSAVGLVYEGQDTRNTVWFEKATSALSYSLTTVAKISGLRGPSVKIGDVIERFELVESKATRTAPVAPSR